MDDEVLRIDGRQTAYRQIGDESVVLDLERSLYFGLNRSAGLLWERLLVGATYDELTALIQADTPSGATKSQINADVDEFLAALRREGLVHECRS